MVAKKMDSVIVLLVIVILGALIGSVIGEVIGTLAPGGYLEKVFSKGVNPGITPPAVLDLKVITLTLGLTMKINLASLLGIALALPSGGRAETAQRPPGPETVAPKNNAPAREKIMGVEQLGPRPRPAKGGSANARRGRRAGSIGGCSPSAASRTGRDGCCAASCWC